MNVYIFGASEMGRKAYQGLMKHCNVRGFIDNDSQKWDRHFEDGLLIYPPDILIDSKEEFVVIIASTYFTEIADQLYGMGINNFIGIPLESGYLSDDNFIEYLELSKKAYLFYKKIEKVQSEIDDIEISDYNKRYLLSKNIKEFYLYVDFIWNIFRFKRDVNTFIDYGGGSGTLAFFAKYIGIRDVYYNDIYDVSANDARLIAEALDIKLKDYIVGDIEDVVKYCIVNKVKFDVVASYDVIEHIYKLEDYFEKLHFVCSNDCVISMWTASGKNDIDYKDLFVKLGNFDRKLLLQADKENSQILGVFIIGKSIQYKLEDMINDRDQSMNRYMVYYNNLVQWISKINNGKTLNKWLDKQNYKNIIIYGAGQIGWIIYEQLKDDKNLSKILVCDSNKNSKVFEGINVMGMDELRDVDTSDYLVIISPIHVATDIKDMLEKHGISNTISIDEIIQEM